MSELTVDQMDAIESGRFRHLAMPTVVFSWQKDSSNKKL